MASLCPLKREACAVNINYQKETKGEGGNVEHLFTLFEYAGRKEVLGRGTQHRISLFLLCRIGAWGMDVSVSSRIRRTHQAPGSLDSWKTDGRNQLANADAYVFTRCADKHCAPQRHRARMFPNPCPPTKPKDMAASHLTRTGLGRNDID